MEMLGVNSRRELVRNGEEANSYHTAPLISLKAYTCGLRILADTNAERQTSECHQADSEVKQGQG